MILLKLLIEAKLLRYDGKYIYFDGGSLSSIPDNEGKAIALQNNKGSMGLAYRNYHGVYMVDIDNKWDKSFKTAEEMIKWLNENGYTNYYGIDDVG